MVPANTCGPVPLTVRVPPTVAPAVVDIEFTVAAPVVRRVPVISRLKDGDVLPIPTLPVPAMTRVELNELVPYKPKPM